MKTVLIDMKGFEAIDSNHKFELEKLGSMVRDLEAQNFDLKEQLCNLNIIIRKGMIENESLRHQSSELMNQVEILRVSDNHLRQENEILKQDLNNSLYERNVMKKNEMIVDLDMNKVGNEILSALVNLKGDQQSREQGITQLERLVIGIKTGDGKIPFNPALTPSSYLVDR